MKKYFLSLFIILIFPQLIFGYCTGGVNYQKAAEIAGLAQKCPEHQPDKWLAGIHQVESSCASNGWDIKGIIHFREAEKKGNIGPKVANRLATICKEAFGNSEDERCKIVNARNSSAMGIFQITSATWLDAKNWAKKEAGITLTNPWDPNEAAIAAAFILKHKGEGFCNDPATAVKFYYGGVGMENYLKKVLAALKGVAIKIVKWFEELEKKLEEMWKYKRQLELTYPEILGVKLPTTTVEVGIEKYLSWVIAFLFQISALILFGLFVYGSIKFLIAGENVLAIEEAKRKISSAFVGVLMLLSLSIVIHTLKPEWVGLKIPPIKLKEMVKEEIEVKPEGPLPSSEVRAEVASAQQIEKGILSKEQAENTEKYIKDAQSRIWPYKQKEGTSSIEHIPKYKVKCGYDKEIEIYTIADLAKCLKNATEKCSCGNMQAICTRPWFFSLPVGCSGDPCKVPKEKEPRASIDNIVLNKFPIEIENLKKAKKKLVELEDFYRGQLNLLENYERQIENCASQRAEFYNLQQYSTSKLLREQKLKEKQGKEFISEAFEQEFKSFDDVLTFLCPVGGKEWEKRLDQSFQYKGFSCPIEIKIGELFDKVHHFGIFMITKLRNAQEGIRMMEEEIANLIKLVSECNRKDRCKANCGCVPNPCFCKGRCPPTCALAGRRCCPCSPTHPHCCACIPLAGSPCLQTVGSCVPVERDKNPCDRKAIEEAVRKIKTAEDEVMNTLEDLKRQKDMVLEILGEKELVKEELSLSSIRKVMTNCILGKSTFLLNWEKAFGNIGAEGPIRFSNPRNLFCCYVERGEVISEVNTDIPPIYSPPVYPTVEGEKVVKSILQKYLQSPEKICDEKEGFKCSDEVKEYKQYNEASKQLMEFLACFKYHLGNLEKEKEIEKDQHFGKIVAISDPKLYGKDKKLATFDEGETCSFIDGPKEPGGCTHPYELEKTTQTISCHYGGRRCRWIKKSFAVDISFEHFWERKYIEDIVRVAKECDPRVEILPEKGQALTFHFSVGQIYGCNCQ